MTVDDAPPSSRRARRAQREADPLLAPVAEPTGPVAGEADGLGGLSDQDAATEAPAAPDTVALAWLADDLITPRRTSADADPLAVDLLARRPRRSPLRPGILVPILAVLALVGAYCATTLLWPLTAVAPTASAAELDDLTAPKAKLAWPDVGSAAVGVDGFDGARASTKDASSMASITKLVTALMVLDESPLQPGETGPTFAFTWQDRQTYYNVLASGESALDVPVDGTLTEYQLLQGMLIGSAGNYADRLASTYWPSDAVFTSAASAWLQKHKLTGITVAGPTGIEPTSVADPASLIALGKLALENPVIAEIVRTRSVDLPGAGTVKNTNGLLSEKTIAGIKTGTLAGGYNLLAAKDVKVDETPVRVYAVVLGQPTDALRGGETKRLLNAVAKQVSKPQVLPAGTVAGTVETAWGAEADIVTDADASAILWNGATASVTPTLTLGDARDADAAVGSVKIAGTLGATTVGVHLTADLPDPDPWWRLTHPLELFGLAG